MIFLLLFLYRSPIHHELADILVEAEAVFQEPAYSDTEIKFLPTFPASGKIQVVGDPDAFDLIDENTILVAMNMPDGMMFALNMDTLPAAIITNSIYLEKKKTVLEGVDTAKLMAEALKGKETRPKDSTRMEDLLARYEGTEVAETGADDLGPYSPTKFWKKIPEC